jgi:ABC-type glutathione transport system ATPase component
MTELSAQPGPPPDARPDAGQESRGSSPRDPGAQLLRTDGLTKHFKIGSALSQRTLHAVDDVSLSVGRREIVALAGESGSGKSTIARLLAKVYKRISSGTAASRPWSSRIRSLPSTRSSASRTA